MEPARWSSSSPDIPTGLGLDAWLDDADWVIPVPSPFELKGDTLVGSLDIDKWSTFRPVDHPWLATELAHIAREMEQVEDASTPSLRTLESAHSFVGRFGLTSAWSEDWLEAAGVYEPFEGPPLEGAVRDLLIHAWQVRQVLIEVAEGAPEHQAAAVIMGSKSHPTIAFLREAAARLTPDFEIHGDQKARLVASVAVRFHGQVSILDLARLQVLADMMASRPVRACQRRGCGKLFVWSQGRRPAAPARRVGLKGPSAEYCSYNHAQAERHARRLEKGVS